MLPVPCCPPPPPRQHPGGREKDRTVAASHWHAAMPGYHRIPGELPWDGKGEEEKAPIAVAGCLTLFCSGSSWQNKVCGSAPRTGQVWWGKMLEMVEKSIPSAAVSRITPRSPRPVLVGSVSLQPFEEQQGWLCFHQAYLFLFFK